MMIMIMMMMMGFDGSGAFYNDIDDDNDDVKISGYAHFCSTSTNMQPVIN